MSNAQSKETKAGAYYNIGNAFMKQQQYQDAVKSYIESLKLNPNDQDTKYNLSYALEKLRQRQQQQNKSKDNKQDRRKNQQNQDQQNQDQQKQNQQQNKEQQAQQRKLRQEGQEKKMAKADAERILEVLKNSEKDVQKKLRVRPAVRAKTEKDW